MIHHTPVPSSSAVFDLKPKITVIGVGGAGGNAVNNMIRSQLQGVEFVICNTDAQALSQSLADRRIQLGGLVTQGLGAGSRPEVGRAAAEESMDEILKQIAGSNMVFVTAGMGGGTGTGAAPVVAQAAREQGILTVGVVSKPFHFEGKHRMRTADHGIEELEQYVDTLIIIPNQNLFRVANEKTTFADAFKMADDVLYSGVRGVTDLMIMPGLINLDFADIRAIMMEMGKAMMGTGEAEGTGRSIAAAEAAISNPLLDDVSMKGARGVLINITGGMDMTLFEVDEAANRIREEVDIDANIIFGSTFDEDMNGRIRVSVVATGINGDEGRHRSKEPHCAYGQNKAIPGRGFVAQPVTSDANGDAEDNDLFNSHFSPDDAFQRTEKGRVNPGQSPAEPTTVLLATTPAADDHQNTPASENDAYTVHGESLDLTSHETLIKARKLGFFERVAETMRSGRISKTEPAVKSPTVLVSNLQENPDDRRFYVAAQDRVPSDPQDPLDVPAYLRRKAK